MGEQTVRVRVSGRVQGVGYRAWTRQTAAGLGLRGWVRNLPDGSVEAVLSGPEDTVRTMLTRMESGPAFAAVSTVSTDADESTLPADHAGFAIRH